MSRKPPATIAPDPVIGRPVAAGDGEEILAEWRADPAIYWKNNTILAAVFAVLAYGVLWFIGNPFPWTGPLAAVLAVGVRALYLRSEVMGDTWRLTKTRLLGPGGRIVPLSSLAEVKLFFGDVLLITRAGDKHLMKYLAEGPAALARIDAARTDAGRTDTTPTDATPAGPDRSDT